MLFESEGRDWRYGQDMCRGAGKLSDLLAEFRDGRRGVTPGMVGGFSSKLATCHRFASRRTEHEETFDPPAVFVGQQRAFKGRYPEMTEVCYDADWLRERPAVVDALQTMPSLVQRTFEEKVSSAAGFHDECEIVFPGQEVVDYPRGEGDYEVGQGDIRVYISDLELDDMYWSEKLDTKHNYALPMELLHERMEVAVREVDRMVPMETPVENINIYACTSTYNLQQEQCYLYSTIPRGYVRRQAKSK